MNISGAATGIYNKMSIGAESVKQKANVAFNKMSETKAGQKISSFLNSVKKIANVPLNMVKKHPKVTIAAGAFITVVGALSSNLPAIGIGVVIMAAGGVALSNSHHAHVKTELEQIRAEKEQINPA